MQHNAKVVMSKYFKMSIALAVSNITSSCSLGFITEVTQVQMSILKNDKTSKTYQQQLEKMVCVFG